MIRKGCNAIRSSPQRREAFYRQCDEKGCPKNLPILDVRTRWNSTYDMIERALEIQTPFNSTLKSNTDMRAYCLNDNHWQELITLMNFLRPLKQATLRILEERNPKIASATLVYHCLLQHFDEFKVQKRREKNRHASWLLEAAAAGAKKLKKYYPESDGKVYVIGTVLHPKFKLEWYKHAGWPDSWIKNCRVIIMKEWDEHYKPTTPSVATSEQSIENRELYYFDNLYEKQMANTLKTPMDELKRYLSEPVATNELTDSNFLQWWKQREVDYPNLSKMPRDYLAVAGSGVPVERFFSSGTDVLTDNRQSMSAEHIKMLMCLKCRKL